MKLHLILVTAALLIAGTASAQHVNIGIKGGLNLSTIHQDNNAEISSRAGYHLGLLSHIHLANQFAMQPELVFSSQGAKYNLSGATAIHKLNYVNVPVMFQYMFDNGFRLQAGPQVGFLLNANSNRDNSSADVINSYKTVDFGLGLGASYVNPATGFGVDARYNLGLRDISENSAVRATNRGFQFGVFYLFGHRS
jgi:hypothetical protein